MATMATASDSTAHEKRMCRTCLRSENLAPIFTRKEHHERYSMALYLSTGLQVKLGDGLPQLICNDCIKSMTTAMQFRTQSQNAEKTLFRWGYKRKILQPSNSKHIETKHTLQVLKPESTPSNDDSESDFFNDGVAALEDANLGDIKKNIVEFDHEKNESIADVQSSESANMYKRFRELLGGPLGGSGPYECRACGKILTKWNSFKQHAKIHLGFDFLCEQCGRTFINGNVLRRHCMTRHGAERTYCCKLCDYRAVGTDQLKVHVRREHTGDRPFVCDACGAGFRTRPHLIHHLSVHQTQRPVQCPQCPATFKSSQHLMCHTSKVHRAQSWRGECYVCGKTYTKLQYVRKHIAKYHRVPIQQQEAIHKVRVYSMD